MQSNLNSDERSQGRFARDLASGGRFGTKSAARAAKAAARALVSMELTGAAGFASIWTTWPTELGATTILTIQAGRSSMHGWLKELVDQAAACLVGADLLAPLGCHHFETFEGVHEITLFPGATETLGGTQDGRITTSPFFLRIDELQGLFDHVQQVYWQSGKVAEDDELQAHICVEGKRGGRPVLLRVLQAAPEQFPTARAADVYERTLVELW